MRCGPVVFGLCALFVVWQCPRAAATGDGYDPVTYWPQAITDSGRFALVQSGGSLRRWDLKTGKGEHLETPRECWRMLGQGLALSADGRWAACRHDDPRQEPTFRDDKGPLDTTKDDTWFLVWELTRPKEARFIRGGDKAFRLEQLFLSPDGKRVAAAFGPAVRVWDVASGERLSAPRMEGDDVSRVCFSPDGKRVCAGAYDGALRVWDAETGRLLARLGGHKGWLLSVRFTASGRYLLALSWAYAGDPPYRGVVILHEVASGKLVLRVPTKSAGKPAVALTADEKAVAVIEPNKPQGTTSFWDVRSGQRLRVIKGMPVVPYPSDPRSPKFSPGLPARAERRGGPDTLGRDQLGRDPHARGRPSSEPGRQLREPFP
jgi:WD40 repeat protein